MTLILPFKGTRFNSRLIEDLSPVLAPPYDVISPEYREELYQRHPNNVVRLILSKESPEDDEYNNKYLRAGCLFQGWKRDGVLVEEDHKAIYLYEQEFSLPDGRICRRKGFFALVKLEEYASGKVRAHEKTIAETKNDRLNLLQATQCNFSGIFMLYSDSDGKVNEVLESVRKRRTWEEVRSDDGIIHRLWVIKRAEPIRALMDSLKPKDLFIADGHHRYETALAYRDEKRKVTGRTDGKQPFDYVMAFLCAFEEEGLVILPTHRVINTELETDLTQEELKETLAESFDLKPFKTDLSAPEKAVEKIFAELARLKKSDEDCGMVMVLPKGDAYAMKLKPDVSVDDLIEDDIHPAIKGLNLTILHHYIINQVWVGNPDIELEKDDIFYERDPGRALKLLQDKRGAAAFFLDPLSPRKVKEIMETGELLPPKSTFFYPKIITGLVMRDLQTN
ncbi:MAG: DUF1015 domain-containing protein [Candidatus Sumerlaeia bacterium]